jgi:ABC-type multidrug transport system fused ATPase/permease subunit
MRLFASPIKLVTVDEPSSALDPEAEYRLFANLRKERKGRTMIFVTHRFGHLTKHADLIVYVSIPVLPLLKSIHVMGSTMSADVNDDSFCYSCVKEGAVVETGTHVELLSKRGEYAHLYNIQAQAFATT